VIRLAFTASEEVTGVPKNRAAWQAKVHARFTVPHGTCFDSYAVELTGTTATILAASPVPCDTATDGWTMAWTTIAVAHWTGAELIGRGLRRIVRQRATEALAELEQATERRAA
jgi:hypothetical protein